MGVGERTKKTSSGKLNVLVQSPKYSTNIMTSSSTFFSSKRSNKQCIIVICTIY